MLKRPFKRDKAKNPIDPHDGPAENAWHETKSEYLESLLGKEHNMVMHAIVPFSVGGALDLYYYPNGLPGTAIATKELVDRHGKGPSNRLYPAYELVMFTKHALNLDEAKDETTLFGAAHDNINRILNMIARYCTEATLNPKDTCEFPEEMEHVGGKCLIFDGYSPSDSAGPKGMGLLLIMEVFRSEMAFAIEQGSDSLLQMLKDAGHYPYSDLDRQPVV
jgi:hypothetical protein